MKRMTAEQKFDWAETHIALWSAKGYSPKQILLGLWNAYSIMGSHKGGEYRLQIGMRHSPGSKVKTRVVAG